MPHPYGRRFVRQPPDGEVRSSQVVSTYGPGAMMDLVDQAVLVGGLDFWSYDKKRGIASIPEPRLRDVLAEQFKAAGRELSKDDPFCEPPVGDNQEPSRFVACRCWSSRGGSSARTPAAARWSEHIEQWSASEPRALKLH